MPLFKVEVTRAYYVEHIVKADDLDHAKEIGSEISDAMEVNRKTFIEAEWKAKEIKSGEVTYTPEQDYLK